ncbi:MAG TPA: putative O-glycosylation ligase, exosortase A system-associated [Steroidobacteraceae bacterium]|nr:putative O-glycosylation ligase, exosortase A system-associated [Steroidobacteraceae bacterium]
MRDLILTLFFICALPWCFMRPYFGVLIWSWFGYMNPHRLAWGFAYHFPFVQITALTTLAGMVFSREPKRMPINGVTVVWLTWVAWMSLTTLFALNPDEAAPEWQRMIKIQIMILVTLLVMYGRERIERLVWCIALSIGFFGIKGGIFTLLTGGQFRVWGPEGSFIEGNNEIALALLIIVPLMRYLQVVQTRRWVRIGLGVSMVLCVFSIVGSYSRGAFLGGAAMLVALWLRSRRKIVMAIPLVFVALAALTFMPEKWAARMESIEGYSADGSAMGRINAWWFAYHVAEDHPFVGGGFDSFSPELFMRYAPNPTDFHDAHSIYFEVLGEHGFVGLALYLTLAVLVMLMGARIIRQVRGRGELKWAADLAAMLQVSFIGFAVSGAFLGLAYFDLPYHIMALMVLLHEHVKEARASSPVTDPAALAGRQSLLGRT